MTDNLLAPSLWRKKQARAVLVEERKFPMMQFFRETNINFIRLRWYAIGLSALIIFIGLLVMFLRGGPKYGVDFLGGTVIQTHFSTPPDLGQVRRSLAAAGFDDAEIKTFGERNEVLIRVQQQEGGTATSDAIMNALRQSFPQNPPEVRRVESVGPRIGKELRTAAIWATLLSLVMILIYVSLRFEFIFAVGAVVALFHDVMVTLSFLVFKDLEINLTVVAAFLTIVGYSLNDTIVVMDRIRENRKKERNKDVESLINKSINQTLSRTILTSLTVMVVVVVLLFFGGEVIHNFSYAMVFGVIAGSYSTIYIAAPIVVEWEKSRLAKAAAPRLKSSAVS
jgi:preprotein translocase SecF subunit